MNKTVFSRKVQAIIIITIIIIIIIIITFISIARIQLYSFQMRLTTLCGGLCQTAPRSSQFFYEKVQYDIPVPPGQNK